MIYSSVNFKPTSNHIPVNVPWDPFVANVYVDTMALLLHKQCFIRRSLVFQISTQPQMMELPGGHFVLSCLAGRLDAREIVCLNSKLDT